MTRWTTFALFALFALGACSRTGLDAWAPVGADTAGLSGPYGGDTELADTAPDEGGGGSDGGGDGGAAVDTGQGGGSGGGSGGGEDTAPEPEHAPQFTSFSASGGDGAIEIEFSTTDEDGDLVGGTFDLYVDTDHRPLRIPDDLDSFVDGGTSRVSVAVSVDACDSRDFSLTATVVDRAGNRSSSRSTGAVVDGGGYTLNEIGDTAAGASNAGSVDRGAVLCGELDAVGNDGRKYTGDYDYTKFQPTSSGTWSFSLDWSASSSDYDIYVLDGSASLVLGYGNDASTTPPETASATLSAGQTYYVVVVGWSGHTGAYSVEMR